MSGYILVVDDEEDFLESIEFVLLKEGHKKIIMESFPERVMQHFHNNEISVAFLDINMPGTSGLELLKQIKEKSPETECVMLTADERISTVVEATKLGAYDYLTKPITPARMTHVLNRMLEHRRMLLALERRSALLGRESLKHPHAFRRIVGRNKAMLRLLHEAELHAASTITVLITGETGVGKELLARSIHEASPRADYDFVAVNMLALTPSLFESEFFGHAKGAFTGADYEKQGLLARAQKGTLFLDEIGDLSLDIQGKLLRLLQEGEYTPVGKTRPVRADVRIVAATNVDLKAAVRRGEFRKDLYYRLQYAHLEIPPLRERLDDIPLIAESLLESLNQKDAELSAEALETLANYDYPGNVRELKGLLESATNLSAGDRITARHLRLSTSKSKSVPAQTADSDESISADDTIEALAEVEKRCILNAYNQLERNKTQTAKALGIGLRTLHRKLSSYGVD